MPPTQDPSHPVPMRVGVLVVAYNAATTLVQTLDRLPSGFRTRVDHILLADDASQDGTYELGIAYRDGSELPLTVVRHEKNLGYGGNQKAATAGRSSADWTSSSCCTATASTRRRCCRTSWRRSCAAMRRRVRLADDGRAGPAGAGCRCTSVSATGS